MRGVIARSMALCLLSNGENPPAGALFGTQGPEVRILSLRPVNLGNPPVSEYGMTERHSARTSTWTANDEGPEFPRGLPILDHELCVELCVELCGDRRDVGAEPVVFG